MAVTARAGKRPASLAALSSEHVLQNYASTLLTAVRKLTGAEQATAHLARAERAVRRALHAREMQVRMVSRADELAGEAERSVERALRALYASLKGKGKGKARRALFPGGLGTALAPRGHQQVAEAERLLTGISRFGAAPTARATADLALAAKALSERWAAAERAHSRLDATRTAENRQLRAFQVSSREA